MKELKKQCEISIFAQVAENGNVEATIEWEGQKHLILGCMLSTLAKFLVHLFGEDAHSAVPAIQAPLHEFITKYQK